MREISGELEFLFGRQGTIGKLGIGKLYASRPGGEIRDPDEKKKQSQELLFVRGE